MARSVLAVLGGFMLWTVLWLVGSGIVNAAFGLDPEAAFFGDPAPLATLVAISVACSLAAGSACGLVDRRRFGRPVWVLAILLLVVGLAVEVAFWTTLPVWYHLAFLILLVPATLAGGAAGARMVRRPGGQPAAR